MKKHLLLFKGMMAVMSLFAFAGANQVTAQKTTLERVHDNVREIAYPQSIHQVYLNPPPLILPKSVHEKGALYQFELSNDKTFPAGKAITAEAKPWLMFSPHKVLEKGAWYWRWKKIGKDGKQGEWSQTYDFQITGDEPEFATPTYETFRKNLPKGYPRLFCFLDEDLKAARQNIATHPEYKEMLNRANMGLNYEPAANPYPKARPTLAFVTYLHTAYTLTEDKQYADKMVAITRAYLKATPDKNLLRDDFFCGDLIEQLLLCYDACHDMFTTQELKQIETLVFEVAKNHHNPMRTGYEETHFFNNHFWQHAFRQMLEMGLMFYENNETAREMLEFCYELWSTRAPAGGFNRDGEWQNGTGYFTANTKTLYYVPSVYSYITGFDFLKHPWYQNAGQALLYAFPVGTMSAGFGDQNERALVPDRQRLAIADYLARETGNSYAAWYASHCAGELRKDYDTRIYRMIRSASKNYPNVKELPADRPNAIWYEDIGEVCAHSAIQNTSRNVFLSFRSSPFGSGSHTLADQNSFNLHFRGVPVYRSTGYYLNFKDAHNILSYRHTRAHNSILVDGIGQPFTTRAYGKITRMLNGENITYALGDASNAYCGISEYPMWIKNFEEAGLAQTPEYGFGETPLTKYRRHILLLHPDIVVIYDELEASKPVTWDWLLHSPVQFRIDNGKHTMTTRYEEKQFSSVAQMFSNQTFEMTQTDQFAAPPDPKKMRKGVNYPNQWHLTAKFQPCAQNRILTIIRIMPDGNKEKVLSRKGNVFTCERWKIEAELDPTKPASLRIFNDRNNATFSLGDGDVEIGNTGYKRLEQGSSVLFDKIDGEWLVHEMSDYQPQFTGAGPK